ncbi:MAG: hypothetical protein KIS92_24640 [Planctomycetota bacterium]|nr:hypothetical protein [Planctomycetota bacterium]
MNLLSIASSLDELGQSEKWAQTAEVLRALDEAMERLEIWYVLRFGRKIPLQAAPSAAPPDLRLELLSVSHTLSNLEIAMNMGLAEQDRCSLLALEALQSLRTIRNGVQDAQQGHGNGRELRAGA